MSLTLFSTRHSSVQISDIINYKKAKQSQLILLETQYSLKRVAFAISVPVTPEDKFRFIYRQPFQVSSEISEG